MLAIARAFSLALILLATLGGCKSLTDSLSAVGGPVPTYLDLLKVTVETIAKGFGK